MDEVSKIQKRKVYPITTICKKRQSSFQKGGDWDKVVVRYLPCQSRLSGKGLCATRKAMLAGNIVCTQKQRQERGHGVTEYRAKCLWNEQFCFVCVPTAEAVKDAVGMIYCIDDLSYPSLSDVSRNASFACSQVVLVVKIKIQRRIHIMNCWMRAKILIVE